MKDSTWMICLYSFHRPACRQPPSLASKRWCIACASAELGDGYSGSSGRRTRSLRMTRRPPCSKIPGCQMAGTRQCHHPDMPRPLGCNRSGMRSRSTRRLHAH